MTKSDRQGLRGDVEESEVQGVEPRMKHSSLLSEGSRHANPRYASLAMEYFELIDEEIDFVRASPI